MPFGSNISANIGRRWYVYRPVKVWDLTAEMYLSAKTGLLTDKHFQTSAANLRAESIARSIQSSLCFSSELHGQNESIPVANVQNFSSPVWKWCLCLKHLSLASFIGLALFLPLRCYLSALCAKKFQKGNKEVSFFCLFVFFGLTQCMLLLRPKHFKSSHMWRINKTHTVQLVAGNICKGVT